MIPTLLRKAHDISRILVVRVLLIAFLAVLSIVLTKVFSIFIPDGISYKVGAESVDHILSIIANSMLTVTTFSLTVMAATHRSVASLWTPRAHQILLQDTTTHTVLATFVGAYLYALIAIVLRETEVFQGEELLVLFGMTLLVALLVVAAIVRWISHLEMFGSLIETASRIEEQTHTAWQMRRQWPALGGHELGSVPENARPVTAERSGYFQQIYQDRLQKAAEEADARIWVTRHVGAFIHRGEEIARTDGGDTGLDDRIRAHLSIGTLRNYAQDPGFGLLNLSEIGSRALSPGVNDPGTGIDAIRRIARVILGDPDGPETGEVSHDRLYLPRFDATRAMERALAPLGRDGAGFVEVQAAFAESLAAIERHGPFDLQLTARRLREAARNRAEEHLTEPEMRRISGD
ncbi:DUF2254 domain-containing protein [Oceanicola sp. 22II-s10i]|uniref:DUF2254 domain-containing protein n=1 Tax=Oceanicola sp. 22II-s10i TaxID=1317116 RepID=UPI000B527AD9|nr:DUF2254 domain-containing protein [Oceanicola sp. 22II-s10i]